VRRVLHHAALLRLQLDRARRHARRLREKLKQALLALDPATPEGKEILELQRATRFIPTKVDNYKGIEAAARSAGLL
jgi:ABC-type phosphate/phosphonate transport system substrate-binding protein